MTTFFIVMLFLATAFLVGCYVFSILKVKKTDLSKFVNRLLIFSVLTLVSYIYAIFSRTKFSADIGFSLYNTFDNLMMLSLFMYVKQYTGNSKGGKLAKNTITIFFIVDTILLVLNFFFGIMYTTSKIKGDFDSHVYMITGVNFLYLFHLAFMYLAVILIMKNLARKIQSTPFMYKVKYGIIMGEIVVSIIINTLCLYLNCMWDWGLVFYPVIAFSTLYYALFYIPRGLMERLLFYTISNMKDGIICLDIEGKCIHANHTAKDYCESGTRADGIDQQVERWFEAKIPPQTDEYSWNSERRVNGKEGFYTVTYKKFFDTHNRYIGCFFIIEDHTEEYINLKNEKYRATHDLLTGIYNKTRFCEKAKKIIDSNPNTTYCIICADVKDFKLVNDVFGFDGGDKVLRNIAAITQRIAVGESAYGRISGDRFAICMPMEKFHEDSILDEYSKAGSVLVNSPIKIHLHIGVYEVKDPKIRVSIMCDRANLAIKTIKDTYRSIVAYYDSTLRENALTEQHVINEFDNALRTGQFIAYIQPQVASDGNIRGGEALVRWNHPKDGIKSPGYFIGILEATGLISRLDIYMWEISCMQLRTWLDNGLSDIYLSVNISQKDILILDVYDTITKLVEKYNIPPKMLHLELTESSIMDDSDKLNDLINRLKAYGFKVEIDDFGSGYSSLNTLKTLNADVIKIDMGFLDGKGDKEKAEIILKEIIILASRLKMEVITEGVENQEDVEFLFQAGTDYYQGYHFSKPVPVNEFETKYLCKKVTVLPDNKDIAEFPYDEKDFNEDELVHEAVTREE